MERAASWRTVIEEALTFDELYILAEKDDELQCVGERTWEERDAELRARAVNLDDEQ